MGFYAGGEMITTFKHGSVSVKIITAKDDSGKYTGVFAIRTASFNASAPGHTAYDDEEKCRLDMIRRAGQIFTSNLDGVESPKERTHSESVIADMRKAYAEQYQTDLFKGI